MDTVYKDTKWCVEYDLTFVKLNAIIYIKYQTF